MPHHASFSLIFDGESNQSDLDCTRFFGNFKSKSSIEKLIVCEREGDDKKTIRVSRSAAEGLEVVMILQPRTPLPHYPVYEGCRQVSIVYSP